MRKADVNLSIEQVITFILIAVALLLIIVLIIGLGENAESIGSTVQRILEAIF